MNDPYRLNRFVSAQDRGDTYAAAVAELRAGHKVSHWMWFVFPQIAGLGRSPMAHEFAISSLADPRPSLPPPPPPARLIECARILRDLEGRSAQEILGGIDAMKLRSSMTLFARAAPDEPVFADVLERYFGGVADEETLRRL